MTPMPYELWDTECAAARCDLGAGSPSAWRRPSCKTAGIRLQSGMQEMATRSGPATRSCGCRSRTPRPEGYFETGFWVSGEQHVKCLGPSRRASGSPKAGLCSLPTTPGHNVADFFTDTTEHAGAQPAARTTAKASRSRVRAQGNSHDQLGSW
jgi:hypothetical protein